MPYTFRAATSSDTQAITDIYNASVIAGGSTADLTPRTFEQRQDWVDSHKPPYGVFVVESSEQPGLVIGFGALSVFYDRAGYDGVTDLAYYIDPAWQGKGVGTFMLQHLLDEARNRHMRKACGIIFADNAGSIALMHRFGFTQFGLMPAAATDSTGAMRDMSYWYLDL
ncbi:acetyltransferase, GNAT family [Bifidobacterium saguini DSM 23967]|uniref:Acetyltransferase, GNAT family n=2 Tax=Bifidobacterium saguini TaxID=762210 RepID=A0A087DC76_9BIFI|nr:GNAT family N-acetyltransferase [Bifidobacterium saguini]KFI93126.1 acetyltransferase, GNAT family [Bifidobacterium saguini DSM 23967]QTB91252.1 N-acetyltransferase [Bifidobacterium saguini]